LTSLVARTSVQSRPLAAMAASISRTSANGLASTLGKIILTTALLSALDEGASRGHAD
jgi:hypothetical protein